MVLAALKAGSDLPYCLPPTYRLCLSLSIPTSLVCKNPNLAPSYFIYFNFVSLTPFIVSVRLTYRHPSLLPTPTFPSWRGIKES